MAVLIVACLALAGSHPAQADDAPARRKAVLLPGTPIVSVTNLEITADDGEKYAVPIGSELAYLFSEGNRMRLRFRNEIEGTCEDPKVILPDDALEIVANADPRTNSKDDFAIADTCCRLLGIDEFGSMLRDIACLFEAESPAQAINRLLNDENERSIEEELLDSIPDKPGYAKYRSSLSIRIAVDRGETAEANRLVTGHHQQFGESACLLYHKARLAAAAEDWASAESFASTFIERVPSSFLGYGQRCQARLRQGKHRKALEDALGGMKRDKRFWRLMPEGVLKSAQAVLEEDASDGSAHAVLSFLIRDNASKRRHAEQALKDDSTKPLANLLLAVLEDVEGDTESANAHYLSAYDGGLRFDSLAFRVGAVWLTDDETRGAGGILIGQALLLSPKDVETRLKVATVAALSGDLDSLQKHLRPLKISLDTSPDHEDFLHAGNGLSSAIWHLEGIAYKTLGDFKRFQTADAEAVRLSPIQRDARLLHNRSITATIRQLPSEVEGWFLSGMTHKQKEAAEKLTKSAEDSESPPSAEDFVRVCGWGGYRLVPKLLQLGAGVDNRDRYGRTPLALAAARGNLEVVSQLLDAGADPNLRWLVPGSEGKAPLQLAVQSKNYLIARLLLDAGADPSKKDASGSSANGILIGKEAASKKPVKFCRYLLALKSMPLITQLTSRVHSCQARRRQLRLDAERNEAFEQRMATIDAAIAEGSVSAVGGRRSRAWLYAATPLDSPGRPITMQTMSGFTRYRESTPQLRQFSLDNQGGLSLAQMDIADNDLARVQYQSALTASLVSRLMLHDTFDSDFKAIHEQTLSLYEASK